MLVLRFGVRAYGLGLRVSGSELRVQFRVEGLGSKILRLRVAIEGFKGLEFKVEI